MSPAPEEPTASSGKVMIWDASPLHHAIKADKIDILGDMAATWRGAARRHLTTAAVVDDRLSTRFNEILAEVGDYSRLVQTQERQQISGALGVLTILGLPLGTAIGILQVLDDTSLSHLLIALALSFAIAAAVLTTRYGRLVLSSLRGGYAPGETVGGADTPRPGGGRK